MTQLIELWETYLLQLDSEEDGPPLMPAGVIADTEPKSDAQLRREAAKAQVEAEEAQSNDQERRLSGSTARDSEEVPRNSSEAAFDGSRASEIDA